MSALPLGGADRSRASGQVSQARHREPLPTGARVRDLYCAHAPGLVREFTRRTGCPEAARDLANETFARLLRMDRASLQRIEHPGAFIRQISTNLLRDWVKARAVADRGKGALELANSGLVDQVSALEARDSLRRLEDAVSRLKPRTREIFLAHRIHGLTYAEIAAEVGLSIKGVEKQIAKAIREIARALGRP